MLADRRAQALVDNFASQWLTLGKLAGVVPDVDAYPEFDENLREAFRQETRLFIGSQLREDRSVTDLLTANYSYRERAAGASLPDPERVRQPLQARDVHRRHTRRAPRSGQHPDRHLLSESDLAGPARPLAARQRARRAAATAAAGHSALERERRRREGDVDPAADGSAPEESVVRRLPRPHGSARVLAREFRRARQVAHRQRRDPRRCLGVAPRRHAISGHRRAPSAGGGPSRTTSRAPSRRSCSPTRSGEVSRRTTCRRSARSHAARQPAGIDGRRSSWVWRRARRSR